jgi:hypothetical protein
MKMEEFATQIALIKTVPLVEMECVLIRNTLELVP